MVSLHEKLNLSGLTTCYGMTETSPVSCMTKISDPLDKKLFTVGQLMPHTIAKVVARNDPTQTLKLGEKGELMIGGYSVMKMYWNDEVRTSEARIVESLTQESGPINRATVQDKPLVWMRTGDEGLIDNEGYVRITGRIKDIIIRGGENIYAPEIENILLQNPHISQACVVGIPDNVYGEVIAAFVIVHDGVVVEDAGTGSHIEHHETTSETMKMTPDIIRAWVQTRASKMLVPKYVFWAASLPLTATGKVEKYKMRELGIDLLRG